MRVLAAKNLVRAAVLSSIGFSAAPSFAGIPTHIKPGFWQVFMDMSPKMTMHMVGDWTWLGACPPGANPGDMGTMVNGNFVKSSDN